MTSDADIWKERVEAHHAQSLRAQHETPESDDFCRPYASAFRADPRRTDDPVLDRLASKVTPHTTVLDVGGGAGRLALPLALRCRHVTVVEPSESMVAELGDGAREAGISNLAVVQGPWEEAEAETADVVLCSHVVYGVADVVSFVEKLSAYAKERVLMFMESPQAWLSPFWSAVHLEERVDLPALPELLNVLWEKGIYPDLEMLEKRAPQAFESREAAMEQLRGRLYVSPGSKQERRLLAAADELLVETPEGLTVRGAHDRRQGLVSWTP